MAFLVTTALACSAADEILHLDKPKRDMSAERWQAEWESRRQTLWAPLVRQAGRARQGMVLRAWLDPPSAAAGSPAQLVLSLVNIGEKPAMPANWSWDIRPEIFVRDSTGAMVKLTEKGSRYSAGPRAGSDFSEPEVLPGHAIGKTINLPDMVQLDRPGTYSLVAAWELHGELSGLAVSEVLSLEIHPPTAAEKRAKVDSADKAWAALADSAGKPRRGCILQAVAAPAKGAPVRLIASLTYVRYEPGWHQDISTGARAIEYHILVHDALGKPVPRSARGELAIHTVQPPYDGGYSLSSGEAVGASIPLGDWFDLTKPGDYYVLVSLTSPPVGGSTWVAEPIKIQSQER
jgi:hypothetical protein